MRLTPVALLLLAATLPSPAQTTLLILSKHDHTLAIVDPASLKIIAKAPVGPDPHEVVASTDGTRAYVSNYGGGAYSTIDVIDLVAHKTLGPIDVSPLGGPHGLDFVDGNIWFTSEAAKAIGRYNLAAHKIDVVLGTGQDHTHMIAVSPDQKRVISINAGSVSIYTLEPTRQGPPPGAAAGPGPRPGGPPPGGQSPGGQSRLQWVHTLIPVGRGSEGFDISPDGKQLWTANSQDGTISVIDLASKKVVQTFNAVINGSNRLKFTPDGRRGLVSILNGTDLVVVDTTTRQVVQRTPIGHGSAGILMDPAANRAFIASTNDNYVVIFDLKTLKVTGHLDAGGEPDGMAWAIRR